MYPNPVSPLIFHTIVMATILNTTFFSPWCGLQPSQKAWSSAKNESSVTFCAAPWALAIFNLKCSGPLKQWPTAHWDLCGPPSLLPSQIILSHSPLNTPSNDGPWLLDSKPLCWRTRLQKDFAPSHLLTYSPALRPSGPAAESVSDRSPPLHNRKFGFRSSSANPQTSI